jgi:hypothetical protein
MLRDMIVLDWSPNFSVFKIVKHFIILKWWKIVKISMNMSKCARLSGHTSLLLCILNISQIDLV